MKRNRYSTRFKAKVALEAIRGIKTINEISTECGVHPNQVSKWKKQVLESLPDLFSTKHGRAEEGDSAEKDRLYQQIGQLQYELSWLKKKTGYTF